MNISRLTNIGLNKGNPHRRLDILRWMQKTSINNPNLLKKTTAKEMARLYIAQGARGTTQQNVQMLMSDMLKKNMIIKHKVGGQKASFRINYLYPNLPYEFIKGANEEDKKYVERTMNIIKEKEAAGLKPKLTDDGAVVTKPEVTKEEPKEEVKEEPKEEPKEEVKEEVNEEPKEEPQLIQTSVPIVVKKEGQSISVTVNLNINL